MTISHRIHRAPKLLRFLALNAVLGVTLGCLVAGLLLVTDAGGFGTLVAQSDSPLVACFLLFGGFSVTFGGVVTSSAVILLAD